MQFRKINYLTLIYHFFTFNYTLGMYKQFHNDVFYRKSKMNVFFPLFTSLNNLEGRPLYLKKRPFALYYYSLFCRENLRETFLPFSFKNKTGLFKILFRYSVKNNFLFLKRIKKNKIFQYYKFVIYTEKNLYLKKKKIFFLYFDLVNKYFGLKNAVLNLEFCRLKVFSRFLFTNNILLKKKRLSVFFHYRKKIFKIQNSMKNRNIKKIKFIRIKINFKLDSLKKNYVFSKIKKFNI